MSNYLVKFIVNGVFNEKYVSGNTDKEARKKIEIQYNGQKIQIISCLFLGGR